MEWDDLDERWNCTFEDLKGRTLTTVVQEDKKVIFGDSEGSVFVLSHDQRCCEHVYIESVVGDFPDLLCHPILLAEEVTNRRIGDVPQSALREDYVCDDDMNESVVMRKPDSYTWTWTWTFFKLATVKGYVDIRFFGSSNGYYSESAELKCLVYQGKPNE